MRKICLFLAICILMSCIGGCSLEDILKDPNAPKENPGYSTVVPVYTDDKQLDLMIFWMPPIEEQQYIWMKEYGVTAMLVDGKYNAQSKDGRKKVLELCDKYDIDAYFHIDRERDGGEILSYSDCLAYSSFAGFYCDEPITKTHIDNIADQARNALALDPDLRMICNILGGYGNFRWWYDSDAKYEIALATGEIFMNYDSYVEYAKKTVFEPYENTLVSATNYPLADYEKGYESTVRSGWLNVLGNCYKTAAETGREMWQFLATTAYHAGDKSDYGRQPTEADIRWTSYAALACGATGLEHFTYLTTGPGIEFEWFDHGPIWWTDEDDFSTYYRTEVWYAGQAVNQELYKFDHVLLSFEWQGVLCHNVKNDKDILAVYRNAVGRLSKYDRIEKIDSTGDLIVGCFKDTNDYDGFMVVNFTETANNNQEENNISITFDYATKALVYIKGEEQLVDLTDHTFTHTLLPGEGFFIIPVA